MKVTDTLSAVTPTVTNTAKVSGAVVSHIENLIEVRAEITRLEKIKANLTAELLAIFEKTDSTALIHRNLELARLDNRSRVGTDEKALELNFPEAYAATRKVTDYSVIVTLYNKG